jgi:dUTP pyrophosphatase
MLKERFEDVNKAIEDINNNIETIRTSLLQIEMEDKKMKNVAVFVEKVSDDVVLPSYAREGDAGMDVRATEDCVIIPGETWIIPTGLKVAIPEGYEIQVRPRSGLSINSKLRIANTPGTIDTGFRGEVGIIVDNIGNSNIKIKKGDRIAQFVLSEVPKIKWVLTLDIKEIGINRNGGFGSTGSE